METRDHESHPSRRPGELRDRRAVLRPATCRQASRSEARGAEDGDAGSRSKVSRHDEAELRCARQARFRPRPTHAWPRNGTRPSRCTRRPSAIKPDFVEGYWYQGTAYYTLENHQACRDAFRKVLKLAPKNGAAYAFLGLCEFGTKEYDKSLQHLMQSRVLGVGDTGELGGTARYHASILMTCAEQFEQALEALGEFAGRG